MARRARPFGELMFLYVGTSDFARDLAYYRDVLRGELVWQFEDFGARVAAFRLGPGPQVLLADHRPAPSSMPIFAVADLKKTARALRARGWKSESGPFEIPNGPCYVFKDPSGNDYAIFQNVRPSVLERAYAGRVPKPTVRPKKKQGRQTSQILRRRTPAADRRIQPPPQDDTPPPFA